MQWNEIFKKEGKVFTKIQEDIPEVLKLFKRHNVRRILDLGCGSGRHTVYFAKQGFDVYGIDIAKEGLNITKSWLKKEGLKANLKMGSVYNKLSYPNDFFDAIISIQVLHHALIERIRKVISELERILKPKGIVFITVTKRKIIPKIRERPKVIAPRTYMPAKGEEKGLLHYIFTKDLLKKEFRNFKIYNIWVDSDKFRYCLLGELKK
ncbi:class I SAM-dependent methyltransferase [Candidatus Woesearchaeota archaeon]|nr:class I SAM-dependent methyltransferase [Candidatus Woesearchaeota archaeon]